MHYVLVVVNKGDSLPSVVHEGRLRILVPSNVINSVGPVVVPEGGGASRKFYLGLATAHAQNKTALGEERKVPTW